MMPGHWNRSTRLNSSGTVLKQSGMVVGATMMRG